MRLLLLVQLPQHLYPTQWPDRDLFHHLDAILRLNSDIPQTSHTLRTDARSISESSTTRTCLPVEASPIASFIFLILGQFLVVACLRNYEIHYLEIRVRKFYTSVHHIDHACAAFGLIVGGDLHLIEI